MDVKNLEGTWLFERQATGGIQTGTAEARCRGGEVVISIAVNGSNTIAIAAEPRGEFLQGKALMVANDLEVSLRIQVLNDGRELIASPSGFRNLEKWRFVRPPVSR